MKIERIKQLWVFYVGNNSYVIIIDNYGLTQIPYNVEATKKSPQPYHFLYHCGACNILRLPQGQLHTLLLLVIP